MTLIDNETKPGLLASQPHSYGPHVAILDEQSFTIEGKRFARRHYGERRWRRPLGARPRRIDEDSQFLSLPSIDELRRAIPAESETFTYLSPAMARVLQRIAEVDQQQRRGFVLLLGPTGCGKTTMAKTYCRLANQPCAELAFSGDTALTDFFTSIELVRDAEARQSTLTVPGPAVEAMLHGKKLIVNEINMLPPDLLTVFFQAMDIGRVVLSGTERGNVEIEVHRDFGLIATANPNYVGTVEMGRAMERRFGRGLGVIEMDYLPPTEEATAIAHELSREPIFAEREIRVAPEVCRAVAELASQLRNDPQIGEVMRTRISTRTLVNWIGLAQITGRPLVDVLEHAFLATIPRDARDQATERARATLDGQRLDPEATTRLSPIRLRWPSLGPGEAISLNRILPPGEQRSRSLPHPGPAVIHRIRFIRELPAGGKVLVAEPMRTVSGRRFGLGLRIRAYDRTGQQIRNPADLEQIIRTLRDEDGLNVLRPLGRTPRDEELLPCLTAHSVQALELAEAALLLGRPVFLAGPTGAGKSSLARTLVALRGTPLVELGFTGETAKTDLSAIRRLIGGVTAWQTQAFLEAMEHGATVVANEYNLAYPDVHSLLNGLFDKGGRFVFPDGRTALVHARARVIATGLLDGPGVKPLNEAVENRFGAIVGLDYPPIEDEAAIIRFIAPSLDRDTIVRCVQLIDYCRRLVAGRVDPAPLAGLSRAAQEALRQAARRAALSTAELVALARFGNGADFAERLRAGILDGAPANVARVLEPVLLQYGLG